MIQQAHIAIETCGHRAMTDLTADVTRIVVESGVTTGLVHVFNVGSTAVIACIEYEAGLERDVRPRERSIVVTVCGQ